MEWCLVFRYLFLRLNQKLQNHVYSMHPLLWLYILLVHTIIEINVRNFSHESREYFDVNSKTFHFKPWFFFLIANYILQLFSQVTCITLHTKAITEIGKEKGGRKKKKAERTETSCTGVEERWPQPLLRELRGENSI